MRVWIACLLFALIFSGCSGSQNHAPIHHVVLIWLKKPGDEEQRRQMVEASRKLAQISSVHSLEIGHPIPSDRKIVDDGYDLAVSMRFKSTDDLQKYLKHPLHVKMTEEHLKPLTEYVVAYDFNAQ